jgi:hypothetical protein
MKVAQYSVARKDSSSSYDSDTWVLLVRMICLGTFPAAIFVLLFPGLFESFVFWVLVGIVSLIAVPYYILLEGVSFVAVWQHPNQSQDLGSNVVRSICLSALAIEIIVFCTLPI